MIACPRAIGRLATGGGLHRRAFVRACSVKWDAAAAAPPSALGRRSTLLVAEATPTLLVAAAAAAAAATAATVAACEAPDDGDGTETHSSTSTAESATGLWFANDLAVPGSAPLQLMGLGCRWKWSVVKVCTTTSLSARSLCSLSCALSAHSLCSLSLCSLSLCSLYPHSRFPLPQSPSTPQPKVYAVGVYVDTARPGFRAAVGAYVPAWNDAATGAARAVDDAFYDAMATAEADKAVVLKLYRGVATATMVQALESALVPRVQQRLLFSKGGDDLKGGMRSLSSTAVALRCEATDSEATVAKKDATAKESVALRYDAMGAAVVASFRELLVREIKGDQLEEGTELVFLWRKSTEAEAGAGTRR